MEMLRIYVPKICRTVFYDNPICGRLQLYVTTVRSLTVFQFPAADWTITVNDCFSVINRTFADPKYTLQPLESDPVTDRMSTIALRESNRSMTIRQSVGSSIGSGTDATNYLIAFYGTIPGRNDGIMMFAKAWLAYHCSYISIWPCKYVSFSVNIYQSTNKIWQYTACVCGSQKLHTVRSSYSVVH